MSESISPRAVDCHHLSHHYISVTAGRSNWALTE